MSAPYRFAAASTISHDPSHCNGCRECKRACPVEGALSFDEGSAAPRFDRTRCIRCHACAEACGSDAIGSVPAQTDRPVIAAPGARPYRA
ncbi:4Fe-4S binding protein [Raoultibacter timonensis]|uniref:4Fe-4S binding protein n=1 Tax=Raoultibacter timonensis TaxID=1907662 RepID=UPI000C852CF1